MSVSAVVQDRAASQVLQEFQDGVDRISRPSISESRSLAEFVRGVLNILTNLVKLFPEQTYYKFVRSTYSTTNPPRSEHIVAGTENLHVAVSDNEAGGKKPQNNIFSNAQIALRATSAEICRNRSKGGAEQNNLILDDAALKTFANSEGFKKRG